MNSKYILLLLLLLILSGCQQSPPSLTTAQREAIATEVSGLVISIFDRANKKDLSFYDLYTDSVTAVFSGKVMESWSDHKKVMHDFFDTQEKIESKAEVVHVDVLSSEAAIVLIKYTIKSTGKDGSVIHSPPSFITYVFDKLDGQWKIIHFHDSEAK